MNDGDLLFCGLMDKLMADEVATVEAMAVWDWLLEFVTDDVACVLRHQHFRLLIYNSADWYYCTPYKSRRFAGGGWRMERWENFSVTPLYGDMGYERLLFEMKDTVENWRELT